MAKIGELIEARGFRSSILGPLIDGTYNDLGDGEGVYVVGPTISATVTGVNVRPEEIQDGTGRVVTLVNEGPGDLIITHDNAGSSVGMRTLTPTGESTVIAANSSIVLTLCPGVGWIDSGDLRTAASLRSPTAGGTTYPISALTDGQYLRLQGNNVVSDPPNADAGPGADFTLLPWKSQAPVTFGGLGTFVTVASIDLAQSGFGTQGTYTILFNAVVQPATLTPDTLEPAMRVGVSCSARYTGDPSKIAELVGTPGIGIDKIGYQGFQNITAQVVVTNGMGGTPSVIALQLRKNNPPTATAYPIAAAYPGIQ